jgi:hypothetical protein
MPRGLEYAIHREPCIEIEILQGQPPFVYLPILPHCGRYQVDQEVLTFLSTDEGSFRVLSLATLRRLISGDMQYGLDKCIHLEVSI